jgi:manganese transport protein
VRLVGLTFAQWLGAAGPYRWLLSWLLYGVGGVLLAMLLWVVFDPWLPEWLRRLGRAPVAMPAAEAELTIPSYRRILVPVDHTGGDRYAVAHAAALARSYGARLHLVHVEEDVTSQIYGEESVTAEVEAGRDYLEELLVALRSQGVEAEVSVSYSPNPKAEIVRLAQRIQPDLVVMGSHGHKGLQDVFYGGTIDGVRHALDIPVLIVRPPA